jgi:hypothetical protein
LILCLPATERIESDRANQEIYAPEQIFHGVSLRILYARFSIVAASGVEFLRTFLAVVHCVVIIGRKFIDWIATSFQLKLWPRIKINCLAPVCPGPFHLEKGFMCSL